MILIFDGNNTFFRNFAASSVADANGNPAGGVVGSIRSLKWLVRETKARRVFWVWDAPGGSKKRRSIITEYKSGRKPHMNREVDESTTDSQKNMMWQLERTEQVLKYLGVTQIAVQDIEADDAIGYLAGQFEGEQKVIVSSDKDMWQLISDQVTVYWPTKKIYITPGDFSKVSPFHPSNYVLARALAMGDSSDNIKGLKGLGEKTLLKIYPTLTICPTSFDHMLEVIRMRLELQDKGELKLTASEKRWFPVILESAELVRTNLQVMQLTSPVISAYSGAVINSAVASTPEFNVTKFKLALINAGIQLTDQDLFTTFQEYRMRATNANV